MLSLNLLGRPELLAAGQPVMLTIRKTWALLLLLAVGGPAPRARVSASLWPGLDERTARRNLRRELARLREAGVAALLRAEGDFLALDPAVELDLRQFDEQLAAGRLDPALALWRGPLADGLRVGDAPEFDDWLAAERERLRGRWRAALEASAAAVEAVGDTEAAIAQWQALLADDPLHERHHAAVMRLHAAAGRREAALAQYERCRAVLQAELGLVPMAETEALAVSLRGVVADSAGSAHTGDTAAVASARPARLLPDLLPFVGRSAEVAALEAAWQQGRAVLIEGEAGVGKTRLAHDFAAAHGPYAAVQCRPGDADLPYAAFARALRALAGPEPALEGQPRWVLDDVARLLPELGTTLPPPLLSAEERNRFFEACTRAWLAWAADNFDAVLLDDWHLADAASRSLLGFVARRRRESGAAGAREILLLRPELDDAAVQALRDSMSALHLTLPPLSGDAVFDLVRRLSGAARPERFAARLQQATAGNPFFLAETLRHLAEQQLLSMGADGAWRTPYDEATQDYRELPVPASVFDAVRARVQRLPVTCVRVLDAAALAAEPFAPALLAPACALSEIDTVLAVEQAVQAQLLREHEAGGFAFAHDLVQQAIDAALGPERRRLVHRRLALGAEAAGAAPAVIASHHEASGERRRAVMHRLAAGEQAQRLHAQAEAIEHWRKGLADAPTALQAMTLHLRLMRGLRMVDQRESSREHAAAAWSLARSGGLPPEARIDPLLELAGEFAREQRAAEAMTILDSLPAGLSAAQQAGALSVRAAALRELGQVEAAVAIGHAALALPALSGRARADLLDAMVIAAHRGGRLSTALDHATAALAISRELGDEFGVARGLNRLGTFKFELGDLAGAETQLQQAVDECERLGLVGLQRGGLYNLCCLYSAQSRSAEVLACAQRIWALQPPMQRSELRVMVHLAFVDAQLALGDLGDAWEHAQAATDDALAGGQPLAAATVLLTALDLFGLLGARAPVERLVAALSDDAVRQMPQVANEMWTARAHFELLAGDAALAGRMLAQVGAPAQIENLRIRVRHGVVTAELALARGDAVAAMAALPDDGAAGMNEEMRLQCMAVRLGAEVRLGTLQAATLQAVRVALETPEVHTASALTLMRALSSLHQAAPDAVPADLLARAAALVARLAASLHAHPAEQAAFLRVNA